MTASCPAADRVGAAFGDWRATEAGRRALTGLPDEPQGHQERERHAAARRAFLRWAEVRHLELSGKQVAVDWYLLCSTPATL